MSQIRNLLFIAWLAVAFFLWQAWSGEQVAAEAAAAAVTAPTATLTDAATPEQPAPSGVPVATVPHTAAAAAPAQSRGPSLQLRNDVMVLDFNGRDVTRAELLHFPQTAAREASPVVLLDPRPTTFFEASADWIDADGRSLAFQPVDGQRSVALAAGQAEVTATFQVTMPMASGSAMPWSALSLTTACSRLAGT